MQAALILIVFPLFIGHLAFGLERILYVNELLSFLGCLLFVRRLNNFLKPQHVVLHLVNFLLVYGLVYAVFSYFFLRQGSSYEFLRTLPLWYSIFAFYVGVEFSGKVIERIGKFLKRIAYPVSGMVLALKIFGIASYSLFALMFAGRRRWLLAGLFVYFSYLWVEGVGSMTAPIVLATYVCVLLALRNLWVQKHLLLNVRLHISLFMLMIVILFLVYQQYSDYYFLGSEAVFGNVDANAIWRLMFWSYGVVHNFLANPLFGIGFGTPIFDASDPTADFIVHANPRDPHLAYTVGMHNSYLTLLERLGLVGFLPVAAINYYLFKRIWKYRLLQHPHVLALFVGYLFMALIAMFHVVLDSPLYASLYWIFCGMLYGLVTRHSHPYAVNLPMRKFSP